MHPLTSYGMNVRLIDLLTLIDVLFDRDVPDETSILRSFVKIPRKSRYFAEPFLPRVAYEIL